MGTLHLGSRFAKAPLPVRSNVDHGAIEMICLTAGRGILVMFQTVEPITPLAGPTK